MKAESHRPLLACFRKFAPVLASLILGVGPLSSGLAQPSAAPEAVASARSRPPEDVAARIREEGYDRSQVMKTLSYLTDVIGPRLTGSPNMKHANEWTRDQMLAWGLTNAQLEAWGPFGYGWTLERFSAQVVTPHNIPIKAYPNAWSPGLNQPVEASLVFLEITNASQLDAYRGKLRGAVVLASPARDVPPRFEPLSRRLEATNLLQLANAEPPLAAGGFTPPPGARPAIPPPRNDDGPPRSGEVGPATGGSRGGTNTPPPFRRRGSGWSRYLPFFTEEGVAAVLIPSSQGDAGVIFVQSASVPTSEGETNRPGAEVPRFGGARVSAYATNAPRTTPQITVAAEDYNRLVRMAQAGEALKLALDMQVRFHTNDVMAYNTVAEIPGSDLKEEIVMIGGHLDSWHSGTGATDNAAGVAVAMEAARIIKALKLQPRRTIRVALWSGEEQGLLGSRAYVTKHFGRFGTNAPTSETAVRSPRDQGDDDRPARSNRPRSTRRLIKERDYDNLSVYFNLDNGAGRIRGIYMQGNEAVRPLFRKWIEPFRDLGAETLTPANTGSTDHISFHNIGLPGFEFLQDPLDYFTRTHHSNADVFDRIQADDMKQASVIMAAFAYQAAMLDEKLPRRVME